MGDAHVEQLAVGEARTGRMKPRSGRSARAADRGDGVVQQPASGPEQLVERLEVRPHPLAGRRARPSRSTRSRRTVRRAGSGSPGSGSRPDRSSPSVGDPPARRTRPAPSLMRDTDDIDVVVRRGVDRHGPPAAADVEQPWPRSAARPERLVVQAEFAADQLVLGGLRLLEGGRRRRRSGRTSRSSTGRGPARRSRCRRRSDG